jgi:hypothetical protein
MRASAIRHLAAGKRSTLVAAAIFEHRVQIWDLDTKAAVKEFETVLSFGGDRLAMHPLGDRCIAAAWKAGKRGGVACYETRTGKLIWHRPDLRQTQRIRFSPGGEAAWCVPDSGPTKLLDSDSGTTVDVVAGLSNIFDSEYSADLLMEKRKRHYILRREKNLQIPRLTFAVLDAAFGPRSLTISESVGPVRCMDLLTGNELWRHLPGRDAHFLRLWYREADRNFYGVLWAFREARFRSLVRLDEKSGEPNVICPLNSWVEAYCANLDCVITSSGEVVGLSDGRLLNRLQFPETDYPDRSESVELPTV